VLTRLANELFANLPGAAPAASSAPLAPFVPLAPIAAASLVAAPVPAQASARPPSSVGAVAPTFVDVPMVGAPTSRSAAPGAPDSDSAAALPGGSQVPSAAAASPGLAPAPASTSGPAQGSALASANPAPSAAVVPRFADAPTGAVPASAPQLHGAAGVDPADFGLPGAAELQALLAPAIVSPRGPATPADFAGSFYFLSESATRGPAPFLAPGEPDDAFRPQLVDDIQLAHPGFDVNAIRKDFPILSETVHGKPLIWFDNAATTQKPQAVIDRLAYFYEHENSNIHRAAHDLAARATDAYEAAREKVRKFLNAGSTNEIVFVRGTTEAIKLVAQSWGRQNIEAGDEIIVTHLEHHANIVPWQQLCAEKGAVLRVAPVDDSGQILLDRYEGLFNSKTRLVSLTQVSNALGTVTPAQKMVAIAHRHGALALVDGAQSVSHMATDVQQLDCDWFVFSGHKVFGPTGIGALYGKEALLNATQPWQGGGNMIADVTFEKTVFQPAPGRFEAGTGNIADAVGLGAAIDYVQRIGMDNIARYEHDLLVYATRALLTIPGLRLIGTATEKASVLSFVLDGYSTEEVGKALNEEGIAVRSGHHCAQPILRRFGLEATVRPSLAFYNTCAEVDTMIAVLRDLKGGRNTLST
jgi:cysteine desulfurase/selenocysteine lyase